MNKLTHYAALIRPLDRGYKSNRAITIITFVLLLLGTLYAFFIGKDIADSLIWGMELGLSAFIAWMIAREIDPDHIASSFLAIPLSVGAFLFTQHIQILLLIGTVLLFRMVNRITGQPARRIESAGLLALGIYVCLHHPAFGLALAAAFLLDSRLPLPHRRHFWYGGAMLISACLIFILFLKPQATYQLSIPWLIFILANGLLFLLVVRQYQYPKSKQDDREHLLNGKRIQVTQLLGLAFMLAHFLYQGDPALFATAAFWSVIIAANLMLLYRLVMQR